MPTVRITTTLAAVEQDARAVAQAIAASHDEIATRSHRAAVQSRLWVGAFAGPLLRTPATAPSRPDHAPRGFLRWARAARKNTSREEYHRCWTAWIERHRAQVRAEIAQQPRTVAALADLAEDRAFGRRPPLSATAARVEDLTAAHASLLAVASALRRARDLRITTVESPDATPAAVVAAIKTHPAWIEAEERRAAIEAADKENRNA